MPRKTTQSLRRLTAVWLLFGRTDAVILRKASRAVVSIAGSGFMLKTLSPDDRRAMCSANNIDVHVQATTPSVVKRGHGDFRYNRCRAVILESSTARCLVVVTNSGTRARGIFGVALYRSAWRRRDAPCISSCVSTAARGCESRSSVSKASTKADVASAVSVWRRLALVARLAKPQCRPGLATPRVWCYYCSLRPRTLAVRNIGFGNREGKQKGAQRN